MSDSEEPSAGPPRGRLLVLSTHNTDFGDAFERESDSRPYFDRFAGVGYAFGVNFHSSLPTYWLILFVTFAIDSVLPTFCTSGAKVATTEAGP